MCIAWYNRSGLLGVKHQASYLVTSYFSFPSVFLSFFPFSLFGLSLFSFLPSSFVNSLSLSLSLSLYISLSLSLYIYIYVYIYVCFVFLIFFLSFFLFFSHLFSLFPLLFRSDVVDLMRVVEYSVTVILFLLRFPPSRSFYSNTHKKSFLFHFHRPKQTSIGLSVPCAAGRLADIHNYASLSRSVPSAPGIDLCGNQPSTSVTNEIQRTISVIRRVQRNISVIRNVRRNVSVIRRVRRNVSVIRGVQGCISVIRRVQGRISVIRGVQGRISVIRGVQGRISVIRGVQRSAPHNEGSAGENQRHEPPDDERSRGLAAVHGAAEVVSQGRVHSTDWGGGGRAVLRSQQRSFHLQPSQEAGKPFGHSL